jgi:hypothetical protein
VTTWHDSIGWVREQVDRRDKGYGYGVAGAALWCIVAAVVAFAQGRSIPLLSLVDLGFHELGHLVTFPFAERVTAAAGSIAQVAVPFGLAVYFGWVRTDTVAASVCLTWAATSAQNVSVYIADAPTQQLVLIGGDHDWAFLLAGNLEKAAPLAHRVWMLGLLMLVVAFALAVATPFLQHWRHEHRHRLNVGAPIRFLD